MRRMPWVSEEDKYVPYGGVILLDVGLLEEKPHLGKWLQFHRENQYIDEKFNEAPVLDEDQFIFVTPVDANNEFEPDPTIHVFWYNVECDADDVDKLPYGWSMCAILPKDNDSPNGRFMAWVPKKMHQTSHKTATRKTLSDSDDSDSDDSDSVDASRTIGSTKTRGRKLGENPSIADVESMMGEMQIENVSFVPRATLKALMHHLGIKYDASKRANSIEMYNSIKETIGEIRTRSAPLSTQPNSLVKVSAGPETPTKSTIKTPTEAPGAPEKPRRRTPPDRKMIVPPSEAQGAPVKAPFGSPGAPKQPRLDSPPDRKLIVPPLEPPGAPVKAPFGSPGAPKQPRLDSPPDRKMIVPPLEPPGAPVKAPAPITETVLALPPPKVLRSMPLEDVQALAAARKLNFYGTRIEVMSSLEKYRQKHAY